MREKKIAVIIGYHGQDGRYLNRYLIKHNYHVYGITRKHIYIDGKIYGDFSIYESKKVINLVQKTQPAEIYYLVAHHSSSEKHTRINVKDEFFLSHKAHVSGLLNFLDAVYLESPKTRIFNAASSLIFGDGEKKSQNESTPYKPDSIYGYTKLQGLLLAQHYRDNLNLYISSGILYNHESKYRESSFLSKKLIKSAHNISLGLKDSLEIGNLSTKTDWGYAPDYVDAIYKIMQLEQAEDFVIATNEVHTVQEFTDTVFSYFGLDYRRYVIQNPMLTEKYNATRKGDYSKLYNKTKWKPNKSFKNMIETLIIDYLEMINDNSTKRN